MLRSHFARPAGVFCGAVVASLSLVSPGAAQVQVSEILVGTPTITGDLHQYRSDGSIVQSHAPGTHGGFGETGLLPDGSWVTVRHQPSLGLVVFDPVSAKELVNVDIDALAGNVLDVDVRGDGTIVLLERAASYGGFLHRFDRHGNHIVTWPVGGSKPTGLYVDEQDGMWVGVFDASGGEVRCYDAEGEETLVLKTLYAPTDLVFEANGIALEGGGLVIVRTIDGWVDTYTTRGKLVSSFPAFGTAIGGSITLLNDGTIWTSAYNFIPEVRHYTRAGQLLHTITCGALPNRITTPRRTRIGSNYCPAVPNSSGHVGELIALGSAVAAENDLHLLAVDLAAGMSAYVLSSPDQGFVAGPGGSAGNLCLGGSIGRHVAQIGTSDAAGAFRIRVDTLAVPLPDGATYAVQPGETRHFQCWYRDGDTSNFTDGVSLTFE